MSYTKGKWEILPTEGANKSEFPQYTVSRFDTGGVRGIALIRGAWLSESDANAHLIVAAPEMYEALIKAYNEVERLSMVTGYTGEAHFPVLEQIRKALAKAEGKK